MGQQIEDLRERARREEDRVEYYEQRKNRRMAEWHRGRKDAFLDLAAEIEGDCAYCSDTGYVTTEKTSGRLAIEPCGFCDRRKSA